MEQFEDVLLLFILSYIVQVIGSFILAYKIYKSKAWFGVSIDMQIWLWVATIARAFWMRDTRLTDIGISYLEIFVSVWLSLYLVFITNYFKDPFYNGTSGYFKARNLIIVVSILSYLFHPVENYTRTYFDFQRLISFTTFLEALAIIPQLIHLDQIGDIKGLTSSYLLWIAVSRAIRVIFWKVMWTKNSIFIMLMIADLIHCALLAKFVIKYVQSILNQEPVLLYSNRKNF